MLGLATTPGGCLSCIVNWPTAPTSPGRASPDQRREQTHELRQSKGKALFFIAFCSDVIIVEAAAAELVPIPTYK